MKRLTGLLAGALLLLPYGLGAYPLDGHPDTGIRRLQAPSPNLPAGALLPSEAVTVSGIDGLPLPPPDRELSAALLAALGDEAPAYAVAVLDLSDPARPRFIAHRPDELANVGSVGKLLVALGWLQWLADRHPEDTAARAALLRSVQVTADDYLVHDEHKVPIYDPGTGRNVSRRLTTGDRGNLWEVLDWTMSASSNGAAALAMKELTTAAHLGDVYASRSQAERDAALAELAPAERGRLMLKAMLGPLSRVGLDPTRIRQGSLFTHTGKQRIPGTTSYASPRELIRLLALIEAGKLVDPWSSIQAKRLLYMTQRRIRYASHPVLNPAAVYFKSGSLYSCQPEPGYSCRKYMGNKVNRLASVAMVEYPARQPQLRYLVAVMSNVLRKNSAVAHQTLALRIHRLLESTHAQRLRDAGLEPARPSSLPPATVEAAEGRGAD